MEVVRWLPEVPAWASQISCNDSYGVGFGQEETETGWTHGELQGYSNPKEFSLPPPALPELSVCTPTCLSPPAPITQTLYSLSVPLFT